MRVERAGLAVLIACTAACASLSGLSDGKGDAATDAGSQAILFGGANSRTGGNPSLLDDTWSWDGTGWTKVATDAVPSARTGAMAASAGGAMVLFGGYVSLAGLGVDANDTWTFRPPLWTAASSGGTGSPHARVSAGAAAFGSSVVLFGGYDNDDTVDLDDTWLWSGQAWTELHPATSPSARDSASMASFHGSVVLFGGIDYASGSDLADTWTWNGTDWTKENPAHSPSARSYASAVTPTGSSSLLLFGGYDDAHMAELGDTWAWDGTDWTELHPAASPGARNDAALAAVPGGALLFGGLEDGETVGDTWLWNGTTWTERVAPGPASRSGAVLAAP